jgi:serine/threonine protein kinase
MDAERIRQVRGLFEAALDVVPEKRSLFIERSCGADDDLRCAVERMLAADAQTRAVIDEPVCSVHLLGNTATADIDRDSIGPYRIERQLGKGGMGTVFLATRADHAYRKHVAIKLLHAGALTAQTLRRFQMEREILASLEHTNIARLLDGGQTNDGMPYIVMDYIEGQPIDDYCNQHELSVAERVKLFCQICDAVQYAHQKLIVHRDLKPGNILVSGDRTVKLLDFGIAKLLNSESSDTLLATATGVRLMTPVYASPEQIRGEPIATASDVYSLGVILYQLLTGYLPYRIRSRSLHEIERIVCEQEPLRASSIVDMKTGEESTSNVHFAMVEAKSGKLKRRLEGDLDNILQKSLAKDASRRYGSVEQLRDDLQRHLDGLPVRSRGDSIVYRASKFAKRHRLAVSSAILVIASLFFGLITAAWQARRAEVIAAEAERQRSNAEKQRSRAEQQAEKARMQEAIASSETRNALLQRERAEAAALIAEQERNKAQRRFDDVRTLANSLFDVQDLIRDLPGTTPARRMVTDRGLRYLNALIREGGADATLQRELASAYEKVADVQGEPEGPNLGDSDGAVESYGLALQLWHSLLRRSPGNHDLHRRWWAVFGKAGIKLQDIGAEAEYLSHSEAGLQTMQHWSNNAHKGSEADRAKELWLKAQMLATRGGEVDVADLYKNALQIIHAAIRSEPIEQTRVEFWPLLHAMVYGSSSAVRLTENVQITSIMVPIYRDAVAADAGYDRLRGDLATVLLIHARSMKEKGATVEANELLRGALNEATRIIRRNKRDSVGGFVLGSALLGLVSDAPRDAIELYRQYLDVLEEDTASDPQNLESLRILYTRLAVMAEIFENRRDRGGARQYRRRSLSAAEQLAKRQEKSQSKIDELPHALRFTARQLFYRLDQRARVSTTSNIAFHYAILLRDGDQYTPVPATTDFVSGDAIRLQFETNEDCYLYIISRGTSGRWTLLHPIETNDQKLKARNTVHIPASGRFRFDETPGTETLYVVLQRDPEPSLARLTRDAVVPDAVISRIFAVERKRFRREFSGSAKIVSVNEGAQPGVFVSKVADDDAPLITVIDLHHK